MPDFPQLIPHRRHQSLSLWLGLCAFAILFLLAGCRPQGGLHTSSDNTRTPGADFNGQPVEIGLPQLAINPQAHSGRFLRINAQFQPAEPLTCGGHVRGPVERWALVGDEWQLDAVGFDQVVRYFPAGEEMTVEGIFRSYTGPLGCGKGAPTETIWYLDVLRIISPNPLTVRRDGELVTISEGDLPIPTPEGTPTLETASPTPTVEETETGTPSATPTLTATTPAAGPSPTLSPSPTPTSTSSAGTTPFPTPTAGTPPGTILPSPAASPTPTSTREGYPPPPPDVPTNTPPPDGYP